MRCSLRRLRQPWRTLRPPCQPNVTALVSQVDVVQTSCTTLSCQWTIDRRHRDAVP